MGSKAEILISLAHGVYNVLVRGRATFECAPPIRNLSQQVAEKPSGAEKLRVSLAECTGMDSTFMGVLAMLGLELKKAGLSMEIVDAAPNLRSLLDGLGISQLFSFFDGSSSDLKAVGPDDWYPAGNTKADIWEKTETIRDAHETLMKVDENNVDKFRKVVDFANTDLENLRASQNSGK